MPYSNFGGTPGQHLQFEGHPDGPTCTWSSSLTGQSSRKPPGTWGPVCPLRHCPRAPFLPLPPMLTEDGPSLTSRQVADMATGHVCTWHDWGGDRSREPPASPPCPAPRAPLARARPPGHLPAAAPDSSPPAGPPSAAASPQRCRVSPRPVGKHSVSAGGRDASWGHMLHSTAVATCTTCPADRFRPQPTASARSLPLAHPTWLHVSVREATDRVVLVVLRHGWGRRRALSAPPPRAL